MTMTNVSKSNARKSPSYSCHELIALGVLTTRSYRRTFFFTHFSFRFQASLSLPGSPFNIRRASRGSHQLSHRNGRPRFTGADTKPLVLNTLLDAEVRLQSKTLVIFFFLSKNVKRNHIVNQIILFAIRFKYYNIRI